MAALGVGLFAQELSMIRVPGIWFPFGVGVSRTEYAYVVFDVALFVLLLRRLRRATSSEFKTPPPLEFNAAGDRVSVP